MYEFKTYTIRELIDKLNNYTKAYDEGHPLISDKEYDDLYFQLNKLEQESGIIYPDSPTQSINFQVMSKLNKVTHDQPPMLSLDKTKSEDELSSFVKGHEWMGMYKLDGLSCRLVYANGNLVQASTRGNGIEGEDVTHNANVISNIPKSIPYFNELIVDGEIICDYEIFKEFEGKYKNPRNLAAGSIRQLSSAEAASRHLSFVAWDLIKGYDDIDFFAWRLEKLDDLGFTTVPRVCDAETISDAINILNDMRAASTYGKYPIDGYVFRFESQSYYESCGRTDHHFRGAIAYKFYDEEYESQLKDIEWSLGRTGVLTPVAIYDDVEIDGTVCNRASLHNVSVLRDTMHTPYVGQKVKIAKMNMIIPQVVWADEDWTIDKPILIETMRCPVCGKQTKLVESDSGVLNLVCDNVNCEGQLLTRIDHFCSKKGLDIKGLSRKTIEKLIDWGWLNGFIDIYKLNEHRTEWESKPGFGKASVNKILDAIDAAGRHPELDAFISALGIPLVGRTVAKEIVKYYETWEDFRNAVGDDWTEFEGFGPEISRSINTFDYSEADKIAAMLDFKQPEVQNENPTPAAAIKNKVFCTTGKLISGQFKNRDELKADIEANGGKMVSSMSSKVDYLITNTPDSGTAKNKKAQELGIKIITEEDYINMK